MPDPFPFSALLIAGFGGFCLNMMNLLEDSKRLPVDRVDKDITYWIFFAFWPILGSGLTFIYIQSGYNVDGILAFTTGLSGPTILQTLMTKSVTPQIGFDKGDTIENEEAEQVGDGDAEEVV